jgi:chorismate--pyruvate lyase
VLSFLSATSPASSTELPWQDYKTANSLNVAFLKVPAAWWPWLLNRGSLTQHLTAASKGNFRMQILNQRVQRPHLSEQALLAMPHRRLALVREVLLYGNNQPWVFARSILPLSTLSGPHRRLRLLDNRPLGALLFADPTMRRGAMQISRLKAGNLPLSAFLSDSETALWGRRSVFYISHKPLLVSEIFLPAFYPYNKPLYKSWRSK